MMDVKPGVTGAPRYKKPSRGAPCPIASWSRQ
ncbi:Uncharacterised protein [Bordetella pertussis]|nr:Uncharacterised protein [Bordetella pertussis]